MFVYELGIDTQPSRCININKQPISRRFEDFDVDGDGGTVSVSVQRTLAARR